ncbi:PREDICTED: uncharacterized protein LOC108776041 [Cyphomyrmex costatus]|uniref:ATP-grasp domain-containing protein n=1 Tax=Cyphomyrmex costatus TaxID=456900 RepID=A0A151IGC1_9HYME|nr:PREDICTED: uncharacterized protein LOC108776041 [Cyphomyrmex costatus]KYN00258.1 hypothetical protein ALC62_08971 [Cyphomyrmex costatus]
MPACSSESSSRLWSSSPPMSRSSSASPPLPGTPLSTSPPRMSPVSMLKRTSSNVIVSTSHAPNSLSRASSLSSISTAILSQRRQQQRQQQQHHHQQGTLAADNRHVERSNDSILSRILSWYFGLLSSLFRSVFNIIGYAIWAPALWASAWICLFWVILQLPLTALKWFITVLHTPAYERSRNKRCVLISGGSTVQAVHLARNFYKAGARVIVCDLEGLFGLARFSTACSKYYTIPRPGPRNIVEYIKALRDIVQRERVAYYIPVSASSTAYYDALAKPHLEIMGCECFVPDASEVTALDDPLELLRRCRMLGLTIPQHFLLRSMQDLSTLYERNTFRNGRYMMLAAGPAGMRDRAKILLPPTFREFRNQHEISERRPWVVIRDPGGDHFITCTTLKESRIVTNVTCRVDEDRGLIPEERPEIIRWLEQFFARPFGGRINGHMSFRLAVSEETGELVSIGCRVGVSLPYICHTGIHPRLVWKPCRHFSRQNSALLSTSTRQLLSDTVVSALKQSTSETAPHLLGTVLDKRESLFVYWDPLPYCAYYHLQLPFRRVAEVIRTQHNPPLAVVQ